MRLFYIYIFLVSQSIVPMYQQAEILVRNKTHNMLVHVQGWYRDHGFTNRRMISDKFILPCLQESVLVETTSTNFFSLLITIATLQGKQGSRHLRLDKGQRFLTICDKHDGIHIEDPTGMICIINPE
jgi:hypothetical protein